MSAFTQLLEFTSHPLFPGLVLALLVAVTLMFSWSPWAQLVSHWRLQARVNKLGKASLSNVYIPDGLGEEIYIEQLLLQDNSLLLVTVKAFRGNIFAAEQIELWTQVLGNHSYKFKNPLYQQQTDIQALKALLPKITIENLVVFARGSRFPKGKPAKVVDYEMLKSLQGTTGDTAPLVQDAWEQLVKQAVPARNMRQSVLYQRGDKRRLIIGIFFGFCSIAYLLWYLGFLPL